MMNSKIKNIALLLLLGFGAISTANAYEDDFFGVSHNFDNRAYCSRPQAYYDARPVYVERPRVVYYDQPTVRYRNYDTQPYYYDDDYDGKYIHKYKHKHHKHHKHDDDDDE